MICKTSALVEEWSYGLDPRRVSYVDPHFITKVKHQRGLGEEVAPLGHFWFDIHPFTGDGKTEEQYTQDNATLIENRLQKT